jgi:hypothetical protein
MGILEGGIIAALFFLAGRFLPGRKRHKLPKPKPAMCSCSHELSFHDPETKHCHAQVRHKTKEIDTPLGGNATWEQVQCPCRQYIGPEPLPPEYFAPEIS